MLVSALYSALVIFGIGLVIFVHELGHFLAARAVGIRVEAFSIGFGRKLWGFKRGPTEYKLCLVPLGGYVKMAGEDPTHPTTGAPDEFGSKSVWQRIIVISAGVIMNLVFALVAFPIAFSAGVRFDAPMIGSVVPGSPAWLAGLKAGDRVTTINGTKALSFEDIMLEVAVSDGPVRLGIDRGGTQLEAEVQAEASGHGFPVIGVRAQEVSEFQIAPELFGTKDKQGTALLRAQALKAAGLSPDDVLLGLNGIPASHSHSRWPLEIDEAGAAPLVLLVRRQGHLREVNVPPVMQTEQGSLRWIIGVRNAMPQEARIKAVVPGGAADALGLRQGDLLLSINGRPLPLDGDLARAMGNGTDPTRTALLSGFPSPPPWPRQATLQVKRQGGGLITLRGDLPSRAARVALLNSFFIPEAPSNLRIRVQAGGPAAEAGLRDGDTLEAVNDVRLKNFDELVAAIQKSRGKPLQVRVRRARNRRTFRVRPRQEQRQHNVVLQGVRPAAGLAGVVSETVRVPFPESLSVGAIYSGRMLKRIVKTLRSILRGSVSARNLGGPITIFRASYQYSRLGIMRGLLFLAVISLNLAILNVLPIPVLDGGWLLFLIIEKIKGSPISERAMGYFQWLGLAFILGLMLFVTWNDITRWLFSG